LAAGEAAADGAGVGQRQADLAFVKLEQGLAKGVENGESEQARGDRRYQRQDELAHRSNPEGDILEPGFTGSGWHRVNPLSPEDLSFGSADQLQGRNGIPVEAYAQLSGCAGMDDPRYDAMRFRSDGVAARSDPNAGCRR
jgi:hypothetical protein